MLAAAFLLLPLAALAAPPEVNTVPWVAANRLIPHDTWSGKEITLKAVADVQGAGFTYSWDFGDGSPVVSGTVTDRYAIAARHTYTGIAGDVYSARLTVENTATGETGSDSYFVQIREKTLETEVNVAIDEGLWYLHRWQTRTTESGVDYGDWRSRSGCSACSGWWSISAANINAFAANGHTEAGPSDNPYTETVQRGMRRLFTYLRAESISNRTYPGIGTVNPDSNGNGLGIRVNQSNYPYQGGMVIDAIVTAGEPANVAATGPANINGRTYLEIVQDMVDSYAFGQYNFGSNRGGWRYSWNQGPDNSAAQWGAIGLIPAERLWGAVVPDWVKTQNEIWLAYSQTTSGSQAGRFGYANRNPSSWGPYAVTPSGMVQMAMDGVGRGDNRWDLSETWMRDRFANVCTSSSPSVCARAAIKDNYYGLFSFVKSMRLHEPAIELLSSQSAGVEPLDWYSAELAKGDVTDGVARTLVRDQQTDGRWIGNYYNSQQQPFDTPWAILMLGQTLFEAGSPVAVAQATPNPGITGQIIALDGAASFHQDPERQIVAWEWDLDNDGTYEAAGPQVTTTFAALGDFPVGLRVTDDSTPARTAETTVTVRITLPPLAPTADAGGPYNFCPNQSWFLDGSGSVNPDEGLSQPGEPGDTIASYEWDLSGDGVFDEALGPQPDVTAYFSGLGVGDYLVRLQVTDTTATSFPASGQADLSDTDAAQVRVRDAADAACSCISDLAARPKSGKVQLTWTDTGAPLYNVYRSTSAGGPYQFIAATDSRYSTYLDTTVTNETTYSYVVRETLPNGTERCQSIEVQATPTANRRSRNNPPEIVSTAPLGATEGILYTYDVDAVDAESDPVTYSLDLAPTGMTIDAVSGFISWLPTNAQVGTQNVAVRATATGGEDTQTWQVVVMNANAPPQIVSTPVTSATENIAYSYDVDAVDTDSGDTLTFSLDTAPAGMIVDAASGLVQWTPGPGQIGANAVTVRVTDAGSLFDTQSFTVAVVEQNLPPSITSTPITTTNENELYSYDVEAIDPNASDTLTFSLDTAPAGMGVDPASGLITWPPAANQLGPHPVAVRVTDMGGLSAVQSFTLTVQNVNEAPVIISTPGTAAIQGGLYSYDADAVDPDAGDVLTFSLDLAPTGMGIDPATGLTQWTPNPGQTGNNPVTIRVTDADGLFDTQSFTIGVANINDAPVITSTPGTSATEDEPYNYDVEAGDADPGDVLTYLLTVAPTGMTIDAASGLIEWTPNSAQVGDNAVSVRVEDGIGGSATQSFTIDVVMANVAPSITSAPGVTATQDQLYSYDVEATDANGDTLTYSLDTAPAGMTIDAISGLVQWTPTGAQLGGSPVTVRVEDPLGLFATQAFTIIVAEPNVAPVITTTPGNAATEGQPYVYDVDASDANGDPLSYSLDTAPAGMTIDAVTGLVQWVPVANQVGSNSVVVRVEDGRGGFATQSYTITATEAPLPPVIGSVPLTDATQDALYTYDVDASDPNTADTLTFSLDLAPAGMTIDPASGLVQWIPDNAQVGDNDVTVRVADPGSLFDTQSFVITVANVNDEPVADAGPDQTVFLADTVTLDGSASFDLDGNTLSFSWTLTGVPTGSGATLLDADTAFPSFDVDLAGDYELELVVNDGTVDSAPDSVTISTENSAPVADAGPDQTTFVTDTVVLDGSGSSDVDGNALSFSWTLTAPTGSSASLSDPTAEMPSFVVDVPGVYTAELIVNDSMADSDADDVVISTLNSAPVADAGPDQSVTTGDTVLLDGSGSFDVDLDPLTFGWSFTDVPTGSSATLSGPGTASPDFVADLPGTYIVQLVVDDGTVLSAADTVNVFVSNPLVVVPDVVGLQQAAAEAAIAAAGLTVGSVTLQGSATVPAGNVISQAPSAGADVSAGSAVDLVVSAGDSALPLDVFVSASPAVLNLGETTTITVSSTGGLAGAVSLSLTVNGAPTPLDGSNQAVVTGSVIGGYEVVATASDPSETVTSTAYFSVADPGDTTPPTVSITAPASGAEITEPVDVIGTANDANLVNYRLLVSPAGENNFTELSSSTSPVVAGVLGRFDPTTLLNGQYDLVVAALDANGTSVAQQVSISVAGDMKVGNFSITIQDMALDLAGIPITINRTYDTRRKAEALDFGHGWSIDYQDVKVQESGTLGDNWTRTVSGGFFPEYCIEPVGLHRVSITLPDGAVEEFDMSVSPRCNTLIPINDVAPVFNPRPGTTSTLSDPTISNLLYNGGTLLDIFGNVDSYDPDRYTLTTQSGYVYTLDQNFGVRQVRDPNGNTLTYGSGGIIHSSGRSVVFGRDAAGRIDTITDPEGNQFTYEYDVNGDLRSVTDPSGNVTRHRYNRSHALTEYVDPDGQTPARNIYDDVGRLIATIDAEGNRLEFSTNIDARTEVVTDRRGNPTVYVYDDEGNVTAETDALGNTTSYVYDASGNELTKTDALGNTVEKSFDAAGRELSETDPLGNTTNNSYNARGQLLTVTNALGDTVSSSFDGNGNLIGQTDPLGNSVSISVDSDGQVTGSTDEAGNTSTFAYDGIGNRTSETDPLGNVTTYTYDSNGNELSRSQTRSTTAGLVTMLTLTQYDANNRIVSATNPLGGTLVTEYTGTGKVSAETDENGNRTTFEYDPRGNLVTTRFADGLVEAQSFDAAGNRISSTDRAGRTTTYQYDAANRHVATVYPDGTTNLSEYDAAGRRIAEIDANGNRTQLEYDAAGRRIARVDGLGNRTQFQYDAVGNEIGTVDALGNTITQSYDPLSRPLSRTFPDGTTSLFSYDALGRKTTETDQAGFTTSFEYDPVGRLIRVTDAVGGQTTYSYDELGNQLTQTDAAGRTTSWEYDSLGRVTSRTLPGGQSETFAYDAVGNVVSKTDFGGDTTTYTYDSNNWLVREAFPDGSEVTYLRTPTGLPSVVTDSRGATSYVYDVRDRLVSVDNPDGSSLSYTYDMQGNRTSVTTAAGTTTYAYDPINRLASTTDSNGVVNTFAYDLVGNRVGLTHGNGSQTTYSYDALHRLVGLTHRRSDGSLLDDYTYTLGPAGNRVQVDELNGRSVSYVYDALYRLVLEDVSVLGIPARTVGYTYDAVGNRLTKTVDGVLTNNYSYDADDRVLNDGVILYTYDADGNTLSRSNGASIDEYSYDFKNRLVAHTVGADSTTYEYDAAGNRVAATVNGVTSRFVVDANREHSEVVEERSDTGQLLVSYVHGDDLLTQTRAGVVSYYHADGLGSTRTLTDSSETVTDTYAYDAFGELLAATGATANTYLFTGERFDPNLGFYQLRARYYDPSLGRFLTLDSFPGFSFDPGSLHKYVYVGNNPVNMVDPSGHFGIVGALYNAAGRAFYTASSYTGYYRFILAARLVQLQIGGASMLAALSTRAQPLLQNSLQYGVRALQSNAFQTARQAASGVGVRLQQAQQSLAATQSSLPRLLGYGSRNPANIQWHHIVEQRLIPQFGARAINSLANLVPTPAHVHSAISNIYSSGAPLLRSQGFSTLRQYMNTLSFEQQHRIGIQIWSRAMQSGGNIVIDDILILL